MRVGEAAYAGRPGALVTSPHIQIDIDERLEPIANELTLCSHRRSQDFCWGHPDDATHLCISRTYTFEAIAGSWRSVSAPAAAESWAVASRQGRQGRQSLGAPE